MERNFLKNEKNPDSLFQQSNDAKWILENEAATISFGTAIAQEMNDLKILLLDGPMGSGKTYLVKGIAKGLEIKETITSPTFPLVKHYLCGKRVLIHLDLYRLENHNSANEIFLQESETANDLNALMTIEWPSRLSIELKNSIKIQLSYFQTNKRLLEILY